MTGKLHTLRNHLPNRDPRPAMAWAERALTLDVLTRLKAARDAQPTADQATTEIAEVHGLLDAYFERMGQNLPTAGHPHRTNGDLEILRRNLPVITQDPHEAMNIGMYAAVCAMLPAVSMVRVASSDPLVQLARLEHAVAVIADGLELVWTEHAAKLLRLRPDLPQDPQRVFLSRDTRTGGMAFLVRED